LNVSILIIVLVDRNLLLVFIEKSK